VVVGLRELLERIRPAGSPGAASEAVARQELAALDEIAHIAQVVASYERQADEIVAQAHRQAGELRAEAERTAGRIRSGLPDRLAMATRPGPLPYVEDRETEQADIAEHARREIERRRAGAQAGAEALVARVIEAMWATTPATAPEPRS
jgi:hypothetical protein